MSVTSFGFNTQGEEVFLYTLENDQIAFSVMNYGAAMVSLIHKPSGKNVLLGFDSVTGYINHDSHIGGFIGRTANRTKNAAFTLNNTEYHLTKNNGENHIHGGVNGFDRVMYEAKETKDSVVFHRLSKDGEEGYPGDLDVTVTYTLLEDGVSMKAEGTAVTQDTIFAMTNHNYYNLDESDSINAHRVMIPADYYAEDSDEGISQLPLLPVEGTPFDFRKEKALGKDIDCDDPQIAGNRGYDHHWAVRGEGLRTFAECRGEQLKLTVNSNLPGMHMYTANFLETTGRNNRSYHPHCAVCFEPEFIPNGINYEGVEKPIVRCGTASVQIIEMHIQSI